MKTFKNLIISAHPDDESIGCFSILEDSFVLCLTSGKGEKEVFNTFYSLVKDGKMLEFPPLNLREYMDFQSVIFSINEAIKDIKFDYVYTHYEFDKNQIHQIISKIVNVMFYNYSNIKGYFEFFTTSDLPETGTMVKQCDKNLKLEALKKYNLRENEINRIISYNEYLGYKYNLGFCEGFRIKYLKT